MPDFLLAVGSENLLDIDPKVDSTHALPAYMLPSAPSDIEIRAIFGEGLAATTASIPERLRGKLLWSATIDSTPAYYPSGRVPEVAATIVSGDATGIFRFPKPSAGCVMRVRCAFPATEITSIWRHPAGVLELRVCFFQGHFEVRTQGRMSVDRLDRNQVMDEFVSLLGYSSVGAPSIQGEDPYRLGPNVLPLRLSNAVVGATPVEFRGVVQPIIPGLRCIFIRKVRRILQGPTTREALLGTRNRSIARNPSDPYGWRIGGEDSSEIAFQDSTIDPGSGHVFDLDAPGLKRYADPTHPAVPYSFYGAEFLQAMALGPYDSVPLAWAKPRTAGTDRQDLEAHLVNFPGYWTVLVSESAQHKIHRLISPIVPWHFVLELLPPLPEAVPFAISRRGLRLERYRLRPNSEVATGPIPANHPLLADKVISRLREDANDPPPGVWELIND